MVVVDPRVGVHVSRYSARVLPNKVDVLTKKVREFEPDLSGFVKVTFVLLLFGLKRFSTHGHISITDFT